MLKSKGSITVETSIVIFIILSVVIMFIYLAILEYQRVLMLSTIQTNIEKNYNLKQSALRYDIESGIKNKSLIKFKDLKIDFSEQNNEFYREIIVRVSCEYNIFSPKIFDLSNKVSVGVKSSAKDELLYFRE